MLFLENVAEIIRKNSSIPISGKIINHAKMKENLRKL